MREKKTEEIKEFFRKTLERGHYCIFKKKQISLEEIINDEKQFRLCCWCRINNILLGVSNLKMRIARLEQRLGGLGKETSKEEKEESPSYIC